MAQNMKAVKLRMKSIESTRQITNAMGLVASSKLRRAKDKADRTLPAFTILRDTLKDIAGNNRDFTSPYTKENGSDKWCYVVIGGDRGLAGGYNSNLFRFTAEQSEGKDCVYLPVGKKAAEYYCSHGAELAGYETGEAAAVTVSQCFAIARFLCEGFRNGKFGHIAMCYTEFKNMLSMENRLVPILPLSDFGTAGGAAGNLIEYKPDPESVFNAIVPEYMTDIIYSGLCESLASELAARRNAMDAATKNADDMLERLTLSYNRARQAGITQEITEIVAGAAD